MEQVVPWPSTRSFVDRIYLLLWPLLLLDAETAETAETAEDALSIHVPAHSAHASNNVIWGEPRSGGTARSSAV